MCVCVGGGGGGGGEEDERSGYILPQREERPGFVPPFHLPHLKQ